MMHQALAPDLAATFPLAEFRVAFGIVARAVPKNSPRAILLAVRLDLGDGEARLTATNLEVWITHVVPCPGYRGAPASVLLDRAPFAEILRVGGGDELSLALTGDGLEVTLGRRSWTLPTADPDGFPACPAAPLTCYHEVDAAELQRAIKRTVKETRPGVDHDTETAVIQLEGLLTGFTLTGGNGKSLAHQKLAATAVGAPPIEDPLPLVPEAAVRVIATLLGGKPPPPVRIGFPRNHVQVEVGDTTLLARLAEGRFMEWRPFLDRFPKPTGSVVLPCGVLKNAVAAAAIAVDDATRRLELTFVADSIHPAEGVMVLSSLSSRGKADVQEAVEWQGEDVQVSFDPQYVQNMLEALGDATPVKLALFPGNIPLKLTTLDGFLGMSQLMGGTQ